MFAANRNADEARFNVYAKMVNILHNEDGIEKKMVKKCIEEVLKSVELQLQRYKEAR